MSAKSTRKRSSGFRKATPVTEKTLEAIKVLEETTPSVLLFVLGMEYHLAGVIGKRKLDEVLCRLSQSVYENKKATSYFSRAQTLYDRALLLEPHPALREAYLSDTNVAGCLRGPKYRVPDWSPSDAADSTNVADMPVHDIPGVAADAETLPHPRTPPVEAADDRAANAATNSSIPVRVITYFSSDFTRCTHSMSFNER